MKEQVVGREIRKRILLLIPHLGGGGAERVVEELARGLSAERYEVHLGLVAGRTSERIPETVQAHELDAGRVRWGALRILGLVRKLRPQVILSGMAHLNFLVLFLRPWFPPGTRVVVRQNTTVSKVLEEGRVPFYTRWLYRWLYGRADLVLCQSEAMAEDLRMALKLPKERIRVALNPIEIPEVREESFPVEGAGCELVAVGRLAQEKGFDLLLGALAELTPQFPRLRLRIAGVGPEDKSLRELCRELQLEERVKFAGFLKEPFAGAGIFILSSRFEGMPNALLEAAARGLPIVCTPCSEGVVELVRGQAGVWLADSVSVLDLTRALKRALNELKPGDQFKHSFLEPFRFERAIAAYERVIDEELDR